MFTYLLAYSLAHSLTYLLTQSLTYSITCLLTQVDKINGIKAKQEEIFREYPFNNVKLPVLPDCNNYYSGKFGDYFWHQNADQVLVYIPIGDDVDKSDIDVIFDVRKVIVNVKDQELISFNCLERIIPDGSFWILGTYYFIIILFSWYVYSLFTHLPETDDKKQNYIQLDLEKRYRMINWKNLFGEASPVDPIDESNKRNEMLQKLFAANKGMSKLTGKTPETIDEMVSDSDMMKSLTSEIRYFFLYPLTHLFIPSLTYSYRSKPYVENADGTTEDADMEDDFDVNDYIKKFDFNKKIIDVEEEK